MGLRGGIHEELCKIMASYGMWRWNPLEFNHTTYEDDIKEEASRHVFFQPPENMKILYPCIVYERSGIDTKYAGNLPYAMKKRYSVTVIDKDPDSTIPDMVAKLPFCSFDRHFVNDNLNHDVFTIYY